MSTELIVTARWRKHTEIPTELTTAIIAVPGEGYGQGCEEPVLLAEMHYFHPKQSSAWKSEVSNESLRHQRFWWLPEDSLTLVLLPPKR